ncbi:MAG: GrpB family protein, partial [Duncaniella sp.]|nr:GrpB family protein [Duncaniella sp.]
MEKALTDMTLEELWQLFPISLVRHNPLWKEWAHQEITFLYGVLSDHYPIITHIGSTAIPDILAKPIIDILVETNLDDKNTIRKTMENNGYICMSDSSKRISFNKGYTPQGYAERVFHIHFHPIGDNQE